MPVIVLWIALSAPVPLVLSDVLADVDARAPALLAERARAQSLGRAADGAGFWDEPYLAFGPDEIATSDPMPMLRAQISQVIPFPGKRGARAESASEAARGARGRVETLRRTLVVTATQMFLRAHYLAHALATNALLQQTLREVRASAEARYVAGAGMHHDAVLADAELAVLARDAMRIERALRAELIALAEVRGAAPDTMAAPAPIPTLVDDVTPRVPVSFEKAIEGHPELEAAAARVRAAEAEARGRALAAWPDVMLQLMWMQSFMHDEPSVGGAMVGFALPVFAPWKQHAQAEAAALGVDAGRRDADALLLRLRTEWERARQDLRSAEETRTLYVERILPALALARESSLQAYVSREAPLMELLSLIRASHQAALESEAADIDVRLASLRLENLLSQSGAMRLAPDAPTLFGGGMGAMGGSSMGSMAPSMGAVPMNMGSGMATPAPGLLSNDAPMSGMGGM